MTCKPQYCSQEKPKYKIKDWMSRVENKHLTQLTIPGTHDSGCRVNLGAARTQTYSIEDQLEAGIRFLDLRCRHIDNLFAIHHGPVYCGINFGDILQICKNFLSVNSKEVILIRVKEEYKPENCTRNFEQTFSEYWDVYKDIMTMTSYIPMLDDVRGKIYVIPNFIYYDGYDWSRAIIQDEFNVPTVFEIDSKCKKIQEFCDIAKTGNMSNFYINFCSGWGYACWPYSIAKDTNFIPMNNTGRLGIVVMDFPGEDAIKHLVDQNMKI